MVAIMCKNNIVIQSAELKQVVIQIIKVCRFLVILNHRISRMQGHYTAEQMTEYVINTL